MTAPRWWDRAQFSRATYVERGEVVTRWWDPRHCRWAKVEDYDGGITPAEICRIGRAYDEPLGGLQ